MFVIDQVVTDSMVSLMENLEHVAKTFKMHMHIEINRERVRIHFEKGIRRGTYDISFDTLKLSNFDVLDKAIYEMCQKMTNN